MCFFHHTSLGRRKFRPARVSLPRAHAAHMPFDAPMLDPPDSPPRASDSADEAAMPAPPPPPDADALAADDAAVAPFFGDGPAPAAASDAADDDGGGDVSDGGGGDLSRRAVAARRLAAVRRLHAAYARQARVLKAAVKAAEKEEKAGGVARGEGCPREVHPGPLASDGTTPANNGAPSPPSLTAAPAGWCAALAAAAPRLARLEAAAARAAAADLDRCGGLAMLLGRSTTATLRSPATSLGRGDSVDVDWGVLDGASAARGVSRRQACLELTARGAFVLTNTGRRTLTVNGAPLAPGEATELGALALVEGGGARALFVPSARAVGRATARSAALAL